MTTSNPTMSLRTLLQVLESSDFETLQEDPDYSTLRPRILQRLTHLHQKFETPCEQTGRLGWSESVHTSTIQIALDLNLFSHLHDSKPLSSAILAKACDADAELVARILRLLAAKQNVKEVGEDLYCANGFSKAITTPATKSAIDMWFMCYSRTVVHFPQFLRERGYQHLQHNRDANFAEAMGTGGKGLFPWLEEHPDVRTSFANLMRNFGEDRLGWVEIYPVEERLLSGADHAQGPILIDIGGSKGHDVKKLLAKFPSLPAGSLIVQDQASIVSEARLENTENIIFQTHDFLTPQPIHGARAYFMHMILHDWNDDICLQILEQLKPALKPGYSKILIADLVVAPRDAGVRCTELDIVMLAMMGTKERTEGAWRELFAKAGLRVNGIWSAPDKGDSVIELEAI